MRKNLYIHVDEPNFFVQQPYICCTYDETAKAIANGDDEVHTFQLAFMSHLFIRAGYDLHIMDHNYDFTFTEEWMNKFPNTDFYAMFNLWKMGELYTIPNE